MISPAMNVPSLGQIDFVEGNVIKESWQFDRLTCGFCGFTFCFVFFVMDLNCKPYIRGNGKKQFLVEGSVTFF